ncbi:hypothetical protein [Actinoplanes awajinensis]|uniref:Uncharacterized protein n=1 Tax=Actinoplanes awajinensis subsp. mycoplanecinus TaxID=135947 RepID=A0A0X3VB44_9ACTN|nr:hypothetical protein [Actinoplanes awajinensis]KUL41647.1 hypothetical protein ADL15_03295 [Actinoplanes awajinensis subsp. mycoplanecinus]
MISTQPELVERDCLPDQVVAAAAVVAATALGGDQLDDHLRAVAMDPAFDARLPAPVEGLASAALEALGSVADRWRRERSKDTDAAEAGRMIAALSQVLAHISVVDDLDAIWNDACDHGADGEVPEGTPPGIQHLASLLRIHGSVMGGGLAFALEVNEPFGSGAPSMP